MLCISCALPYHDMSCQYLLFFMSLLFIMMSPLTIYCIHSSLTSHIYNITRQIHHPHQILKNMKITLLLTILGVSANTVSAFDLPEFLRGNNKCDCERDSDCSGFCDVNTSCNVKNNASNLTGKCSSGSGNNNNNRSGDSCECKYDNDCNGNNSWW